MITRDPGRQALDELLAHVDAESARECAAIQDEAASVARDLLADARHQARRRVGVALAAERAEWKAHCVRERAAAETRVRTQRQVLARRAMEQGWRILESELVRRWQIPEGRRRWACAALRTARAFFMARSWQAYHPPQWTQSEREVVFAEAIGGDDVVVEWHEDAALVSGLRIEADGAQLDATPAGLTARREQVEGRLLAAIGESARSAGPTS